MSAKTYRKHPGINPLHLLAGVLATGLSVPALLRQSVPFPTYVPGAQTDGSFVVASGQVITPAGTYVNLGTTTRAKAIALNPTGNNTAAVLQMGAPQVVTVFNTKTGAVLQTFKPTIGAGGSSTGITYTPDGKYLLFSQDGDYGPSYFAVASVSASGMLTNFANVAVPIAVDSTGKFTNVTCFGVRSHEGTAGATSQGRQPFGNHRQLQYSLRLLRFALLRSGAYLLSHGHRGLVGCHDRIRSAGQQRHAGQDHTGRDASQECGDSRG